MGYSDLTWSYKDPTTSQKLNQMSDNSVWTSEQSIFGCQMTVSSTDTVQIYPGLMAIGDQWVRETGVADITTLTASNAAHWEDGNGEGSSSAWWVVAFQSGNGFNVLFRQSAPAYSDTNSSTANGAKIYDKTGSTWYRYLGMVYNNTANALEYSQCSRFFPRTIQTVRRGNYPYITGTNNVDLTGAMPTNASGFQVMSLSIWATHPANKFEIEVNGNIISSNASTVQNMLLFRNEKVTAIAAIETVAGANEGNILTVFHTTDSQTAGEAIFNVRIGADISIGFNGTVSSGMHWLDGTKSSMTITEIEG